MKALPFPCIRPLPQHAAQAASLPYDVFDRKEAADYVVDRPLSFLNIDRPETPASTCATQTAATTSTSSRWMVACKPAWSPYVP